MEHPMSTAAAAAAPDAVPERSSSQRWMDWLTEQGYQPRLEVYDADPDQRRLLLTLEGMRPYLYLLDSDPTYYNLSLCYRLTDDAGVSRLALLHAANEVNSFAKCTRASVIFANRIALFDSERFTEELPTPEIFARTLAQCHDGAMRFFSIIRTAPRPAELLS
jgi:hypothetical protein